MDFGVTPTFQEVQGGEPWPQESRVGGGVPRVSLGGAGSLFYRLTVPLDSTGAE